MGAVRRPRRAAAVVVLGAALVLSACQGEAEPKPTAKHTEDGLSTPGSVLQLGETGTIPRRDAEAVIAFTITEVTQGSPDDLVASGFPEMQDRTPYYVHYTMEHVSGMAWGVDPRHYLSGWAEDEPLTEMIFPRAFPLCERANFPTDTRPGTTVTGCRTYVTRAGATAPIDEVMLDNSQDYEGADGTAVLWDVPEVG